MEKAKAEGLSGNLARAICDLLEAVRQEMGGACERCWCDSCGKLEDCPVFLCRNVRQASGVCPAPCSGCEGGPMLGRHNGACRYYEKDS